MENLKRQSVAQLKTKTKLNWNEKEQKCVETKKKSLIHNHHYFMTYFYGPMSTIVPEVL